MGDRLTVYEKPTCTTCKKLVLLLKDRGYDFDRINYMIDPVPEAKLRELMRKSGLPARDLIRTKEEKYRELKLENVSDDEIIRALVEHPELLQRPIVEKGDRAVLARPPEKVREIL